MTTQQIHLFNCLCLAVFVVVALFTRATARRIAGALVGGVTFGVVAMGIIVLGEEVGWWHRLATFPFGTSKLFAAGLFEESRSGWPLAGRPLLFYLIVLNFWVMMSPSCWTSASWRRRAGVMRAQI